MNPRIQPVFALLLVFLGGCPQVWPDVVTCEEQNACGTTEPASTGSDGPPTTSEGVNTVTGESSGDTGDSSSSGALVDPTSFSVRGGDVEQDPRSNRACGFPAHGLRVVSRDAALRSLRVLDGPA
jgi:hypothetical protein